MYTTSHQYNINQHNRNMAHIDLVKTCDDINTSYTSIKSTYARINSRIDNMTKKLDDIETLVIRHKNRNQENRPACVPGFYQTVKPKSALTNPTVLGTSNSSVKQLSAAGTAQNAVRVIRNTHYR